MNSSEEISSLRSLIREGKLLFILLFSIPLSGLVIATLAGIFSIPPKETEIYQYVVAVKATAVPRVSFISPRESNGSAVCVKRNAEVAYLLTAAHVAREIELDEVDQILYKNASLQITSRYLLGEKAVKVISINDEMDLALLQLTGRNNLRSAKIYRGNRAPYDTEVRLIGNPYGIGLKVIVGRAFGMHDILGVRVQEIQGPIHPGMSGGGCFLYPSMELMGIAVSAYRTPSRESLFGYCVTSYNIRKFLSNLSKN